MAAGILQSEASSASSSMTKTPQKVRENSDRVIDNLNIRYDLQLPKQHGRPPQDLLDSQNNIQQRCSARIRFLFWKSAVDVAEVVRDFEEWARAYLSHWIHKPSQEPGTLPSQSSTRSFIKDGARQTAASFTVEQKENLTRELERRLKDECDLASNSDVYTRRRSAMQPPAPKIPAHKSSRNLINAPYGTGIAGGVQYPRIDTNLKRKKPSSEAPDVSPTKRRSLSGSECPSAYTDLKRLSTTSFSEKNLLSFNTTASSEVPEVFSQALPTEPNSPATTASEPGSPAQQDVLSQDMFPEFPDFFAKSETLQRSLHEADEPQFDSVDLTKPSPIIDKFLDELIEDGPMHKEDTKFWQRVPLRNRYEILRICGSLKLRAVDLLKNDTLRKTSDRQSFWQSVRGLPGVDSLRIPERPNPRAWDSATGKFEDPETSRSVILSGVLTWCNPPVRGLLQLDLKALKLEQSCRFHRRFGSDRFLELILPSLGKDDIPSHLQKHQAELHAAICQWLTKTFYLLGRQWRVFYEEEFKRPTKSVARGSHKLHLFAIDGNDFLLPANDLDQSLTRFGRRAPMSIHDLLDWYMPFGKNLNSTDCKLFQRLALGLSKNTATVIFTAAEFVWLKDKEPVMNDGCARISKSAANDIAGRLGLQSTPSVFQGRIAGAKGIWMVEQDDAFGQSSDRGYCIEVSDSQLKFSPHPRDNALADPEQRTFEVNSWSQPPRVASLTKQFLTILYDRGVPFQVLQNFMRAETHDFFENLRNSMSSSLKLRTWMQTALRYSRSPDGVQYQGPWPSKYEEQAIYLIESGFLPDSCPQLLSHLRSFLYDYFDRYIEKMAITIPRTTDVYCIADPYGVLAWDEVHLGFSEIWSDVNSGISDNILDEIDVLVARSPALLPSDIQRRKASWKRELRHFKDVIVFSTQGNTPLASMLSGGDYDGDRVWVCWNPDLVEHFKNSDLPSNPPSPEECELKQVSRKMSSIFTPERLTNDATDDFLHSCFQFNLRPALLGICTNAHERLVYQSDSLASPAAIKLAMIAGYLVDSSKQGLSLSADSWQNILRQTGCRGLQDPAYKAESSGTWKTTNIIDKLKFETAIPEKEQKLTEFYKLWPERRVFDFDLARPSGEASRQIKIEESQGRNSRMKEILDELDKQIVNIHKHWALKCGPGLEKSDQGAFFRLVQNLSEEVDKLEPLHLDHAMILKCEWEINNHRWRALKASRIYVKNRASTFPWHMVGPDLCRIKLQACEAETGEPARGVINGIHRALQINKKLVRRLQDRENEEMGGDESASDSE
ncbi:MAG: hypothetical protein Q9227_009174 [Pyrenula ochraceoflavens]